MSWSGVADNADGAVECLARSGDALRFLNQANVFCRFVLGRQLLLIQERHLWERIERPISEGESESRGPCHSWEDFMAHAFPQITGLSQKIGYAAMTLTNSPALRKLPETELKKFGNLSNAVTLVRLERKGVHITEELILAAQTLPVESFRQLAGFGKRATVEVVVDGRDTACKLQWINDVLKRADANALGAFLEVLQYAMVEGGGNATDAIIASVLPARSNGGRKLYRVESSGEVIVCSEMFS